MTNVYLTTAECAVLEVLADGSWLTPSEIAQIAPAGALHVQVIRGALKDLAHYHLAERGGWGNSMRWGEWRITPAGRRRVHDARQMRLRVVESA